MKSRNQPTEPTDFVFQERIAIIMEACDVTEKEAAQMEREQREWIERQGEQCNLF
jgi:inosine-uridine nucleoside N-ribohydrolase